MDFERHRARQTVLEAIERMEDGGRRPETAVFIALSWAMNLLSTEQIHELAQVINDDWDGYLERKMKATQTASDDSAESAGHASG